MEKQMDPCTGLWLIPGLHGKDCPGNGNEPGLECCCDECDYYLLCFPDWNEAPFSKDHDIPTGVK